MSDDVKPATDAIESVRWIAGSLGPVISVHKQHLEGVLQAYDAEKARADELLESLERCLAALRPFDPTDYDDCGGPHLAQGIAKLGARVETAERRAAWFAGEYQEQRPEILEWRRLADTPSRTAEQSRRMEEIARLIEDEMSEAPDLRKRIAELKAALRRIDEIAAGAESSGTEPEWIQPAAEAFVVLRRRVKALRGACRDVLYDLIQTENLGEFSSLRSEIQALQWALQEDQRQP